LPSSGTAIGPHGRERVRRRLADVDRRVAERVLECRQPVGAGLRQLVGCAPPRVHVALLERVQRLRQRPTRVGLVVRPLLTAGAEQQNAAQGDAGLPEPRPGAAAFIVSSSTA